MEIKTAYSILEKYLNHEDNPYKISLIETAMKEYAEQFIDLASEKATTMDDPNSYTGNTGSEWPADVVVDKQSILKVKQLIK